MVGEGVVGGLGMIYSEGTKLGPVIKVEAAGARGSALSVALRAIAWRNSAIRGSLLVARQRSSHGPMDGQSLKAVAL